VPHVDLALASEHCQVHMQFIEELFVFARISTKDRRGAWWIDWIDGVGHIVRTCFLTTIMYPYTLTPLSRGRVQYGCIPEVLTRPLEKLEKGGTADA
jgi:hypothetical protein